MPDSGTSSTALARRLLQLRKSHRDLTQEMLATAFSSEKRVSAPTVSGWESMRSPKIPAENRLDAYARFFATSRSISADGVRLLSVDDIRTVDADLQQYHQLRAELLELAQRPGRAPLDDGLPQRTLLQFDEGDVVTVCPELPPEARGPLADPASPNYTRLHQFADSDALLEVFGHLRALNPDRKILQRISGAFEQNELQNHLVLIGGIGWSRTTEEILAKLVDFPIAQVATEELATGEIFQVLSDGAEPRSYFPVMHPDGRLSQDVALVARVRNPFNSNRTLTLLNGVHSRGVLGAALAVTDETIRKGNQEYLAERFPSGSFALLMRVDLVQGRVMAPDFHNEKARLFEWSPEEGEE